MTGKRSLWFLKMSDDADSPPEREMKDFQFRQMKKVKVFEPAKDLPRERSNLLTISNKFGLTFAGSDQTFKVYRTEDILKADKVDGNSNETVDGVAPLAEVTVDLYLHHLALSCDEVTLSVCGAYEDGALSLVFYDVRNFVNQAKPQKSPFASVLPPVPPGTLVQDLRWNPAQASMLAACLSDGGMQILDVADSVGVRAELPASSGITCICWSPKGKQVAAGKMNGTVSQYTPALEKKKDIACPHFYTSEEPVKVLDVLWLRTFVFAVVYAAADGSLETPPELVFVSLPKKDENVETKYLNFSDTVYGSCTERQHHYFLSHVEDWDLVFAASAASIEVSVIARQDDKIWELWVLEDASRAELPVTDTNDDTLPLGVAIDFTSQQEIHITDEKTLPPVPVMLMLSTEGLLCPFALLNFNPGVKQLVSAPSGLAVDGERLPKPGSLAAKPPKSSFSATSAPGLFPSLGVASAAAPAAPTAPSSTSFSSPFSFGPPAGMPVAPVAAAAAATTSASSVFPVPTTCSTTTPSAFTLGGSSAFVSGASGFSFASKPPSETPAGPSAFSFAPTIKPAPAPSPTPQSLAAAPLAPTVKLNLNERFSASESSGPQSFTFSSPLNKTAASNPANLSTPAPKPAAVLAPVRPVQTSTPSTVVQKPAPAAQNRVQIPQAPVNVKALEKQLQQKKDSDPIMAGILEEIAHFQKELDDLKARSAKADFKVGTVEEMKDLRKESDDLHVFTLEIKETTESLHGDISTLNTTMLEGFAGSEEAKAQSELRRDRNYRQLLYKKPLDPRSEQQLKEIRRLYQYVMFAVEDVNDVLDVEWEKHLEKKRKQKHMVVPGRENLFTTLANNLYIINQQKNRLDSLVKELTSLRLYNKTANPALNSHTTAAATAADLESELENLRDALLKTKLESTSPQPNGKSPISKISPVKQSQLRNFLSKGQMPPVRSTAPAKLSRSAFLSPKYYEDLDDVSSTSSLSQSLEPHPAHLELEEDELQPEPLPAAVIPSLLSTPRHPTVVRTPSIQPGFGAIQSTPVTKLQSVQGIGFGLSPIASPIPTNKINLSGAESTALATKTVKHGAPPTERTVPVTVSAQQAAATAALRRQLANQRPESTLKTVPQVVNVQELQDKGPPVAVPNLSSPALDPAAQVFAAVSANLAKRTTQTQSAQKVPAESTTASPGNFVFGQPSKPDSSVAPASSAEPTSSKGFSFATGAPSFSSVPQGAGMSQVKEAGKFSFGGNGKALFGQVIEESIASAASSTASNASGDKPSASALRVEPQPSKLAGGETLGSFSGLRVGQGEDAKDALAKDKFTAASFSFGDPGLVLGKVKPQFTFDTSAQAAAKFPPATDFSKAVASGSLFKPPDTSSTAKPTFSMPQFGVAPSMSFSSILAAPSSTSETPNLVTAPSESTTPPPPEKEPEPIVEPISLAVVPEPSEAVEAAAATPPAPPPPAAAADPVPEPSTAAGSEAAAPVPAFSAAPAVDATPDSTTAAAAVSPSPTSSIAATAASAAATPTTANPAASAAPQAPPPAFQLLTSENPGSIFTQPPPPPTTDSSSLKVTPVISTVAPAATTVTAVVASGETSAAAAAAAAVTTTVTAATAATTATAATSVAAAAAATANTVFGQPAAPPASTAPAAPASTGFGSPGFGAASGTGFGKPAFGQSSSFGSNSGAGTASGFSFAQPAFGASANSTTSGGGGLFGASTTGAALSSFSFGSSSASTPSSTGAGLFGSSTSTSFGQSSRFGSVFGSNTTTSSSAGFSFAQPSAFGSSSSAPAFGQQQSGGGLFGQQQQQQPSSGGSLFGSSSANTGGSAAASGGFFSGLGGKPSEDAANKNPFGAPAATGGFGQPAQTGANSLFGNSGAKAFNFGQPSSFSEQKPSGTFTTGGGTVASQGFGSFGTPTKPGGFGSAPVFGSPPAFGSPSAFGGTPSFGSTATFSNAMNPSASKVFGEGTTAANMGGFGFASPPSGPSFGSLANQSAPSFGALAQQGAGFGNQPGALAQQGAGFGNQAGALAQQGAGFGNQPSGFSSFGQPQLQQLQPQPQPQPQPQAPGFTANAFGSSNQPGTQTFSSWRS